MGHAKPRYVNQTERWSDLNIQFRRRSSSCSIRSKQWVMRRRTSLVKWRLCVTTRRSVVTNQNYFRFERQLQPCQSRPSFESALVRVSPRQSRPSSESVLVRVGPRQSRSSSESALIKTFYPSEYEDHSAELGLFTGRVGGQSDAAITPTGDRGIECHQ